MNNREASAAIVADLNRDLANVKRAIAAQWVDGEFRGDDEEDAYHHAVMGQILRDLERHTESPTAVLVRRARELNHGFLACRRARDYPRANACRACREKVMQDARMLARAKLTFEARA